MAGATTDRGVQYPCCAPHRGRWEGIRPHVVNLTDGQFSQTGRMHTCVHDVDAIFDNHLPAFLDEAAGMYGDGPVPLVIWAHGGVVSETRGLTIAENQVPWWLANGVYPLHFVWETGFVETARQVFGRRARHRLNHDPSLGPGPVLEVPEYSGQLAARPWVCLLYTSDAADEL